MLMKEEHNILLLSFEELFIIQIEKLCLNKRPTDKPSVDTTYQTSNRNAQDM